MQVLNKKEVANHVVPESCVSHREVWREAFTGVRIGPPLSRDRNVVPGAHAAPKAEGKTSGRVLAPQAPRRPGVVGDPGMCARSIREPRGTAIERVLSVAISDAHLSRCRGASTST